MKERSLTPVFLSALVTLILLWAALDFLIFVRDIRAKTQDTNMPQWARPDAVVALTGGNGLRIALAVSKARSLELPVLITGVNPGASLASISAMSGVNVEFLQCCVDIDRKARNTVENGMQIALWATQNQYNNLAIVTSDYHIKRAMIEINNALPQASLIPLVTTTTQLHGKNWWTNRNAVGLLIREWAKLKISSLTFAVSSLIR